MKEKTSGFFWEIFLICFHQWWDKAALPFLRMIPGRVHGFLLQSGNYRLSVVNRIIR